MNYIINLISCFISTLKAGHSQCVISIININLFYSHPSSIEIFPYSAVSDMNMISLGNSTSCPIHGIRPWDQCEGVAKLLLHCQTLSAPSALWRNMINKRRFMVGFILRAQIIYPGLIRELFCFNTGVIILLFILFSVSEK